MTQSAEKPRKQDIPVGGAYDKLLRRYGEFMHGLTMLPIYVIAVAIMGLALMPGICIFRSWSEATENSTPFIHAFAIGASIAAGFICYGFSLLILCPLFNAPVLRFFKPTRGPFRSAQIFPWYYHNAVLYIARYTFLEFITPTPFNTWFYKMMGMKMGRGVHINTTHISDPGLLTMEDHVTIGGSATIIAHYGTAGYLVLHPTIIRRKATIGLRAIIMADVEIGEGAKILPNSVVLPKTRVPAGETWGGVPAKKLEPKDYIVQDQ